MKRFVSGLRRSRSGSTVVELAFVLPILLIVLFGIVDFGRIFWHSNLLHTAAREGARVMAVTGKSGTTDVYQRINDVLSTAGIVLDSGDIELTWSTTPSTLATVEVVVNYDFEFFAGPILGIIPGTIPLSARCVMKDEAGSPPS